MSSLPPVFLLAVLGANPAAEWDRLPSLPDREGFAGSFAGVSNGALLVAGGANFPDRKPWDGGTKVWSDTVFAMDRPTGVWKVAGRLRRPLAYGVSVTHRTGVVFVGGSDAARHHAAAFRHEWKAGTVVTSPLPPLPRPIAHACGALLGDTMYVAGGQTAPDDRATVAIVYRLDLATTEPRWEEVGPCPGGGRMLAVAAAFDGAFWIVGGVDLVANGDAVERRYLKDAYRYDPGKGWGRVADLPHPVAAAASPAPADGAGFYVLGGDDGTQVGLPPNRHRGFRKTVLRFDGKTATWAAAGELPAPRVTVPVAWWDGGWVIPSGEVRPGVRSPDVWRWTPRAKEQP